MSQSDGTDKILGYLDLSRSIDTWDVSWRSDSSPFLDAGNNWGAILFPETVPCYFFFPHLLPRARPSPRVAGRLARITRSNSASSTGF